MSLHIGAKESRVRLSFTKKMTSSQSKASRSWGASRYCEEQYRGELQDIVKNNILMTGRNGLPPKKGKKQSQQSQRSRAKVEASIRGDEELDYDRITECEA